MHFLKHWGLGLAAVVASALLATSAHAQTNFEHATFSNVNPGEVVTITVNGTQESGWAGFYNFINGSGALNGSFSGFCIDVSQDINGGQTVWFDGNSLENAPVDPNPDPMGTTRANLIRQLWAAEYNSLGSPNQSIANSNAAAFQIAIWEIINGSLSDLSVTDQNSTFKVADSDGATLTTANNYLIAAENGTAMNTSLYALTSLTAQDYVVQLPVPAPPGLMLGLTGVVSLILPSAWRWRKRASLAAVAAP